MERINYACNAIAHESSDRTSTGLSPSLEASLSYILGWVSGIIFLILERRSKFVRFHAIQSILMFGSVSVAMYLIGFIPVAGWIINVLIGFAAFAYWIVLIARASLGEACSVPLAGNIAKQELKNRS